MGWVPTPAEQSVGEFSIILIPDTQYLSETSSWTPHFQALADWIVANQDEYSIDLVLHLGDVTDDGNVTQFDRAQTPMETIWDSGIPFAACIGNHDYNGAASGDVTDHDDTSLWNTYFGPSQYTGRSWWDGDFRTAGESENMYFYTNLGGRPTLILVLEFYPRAAVLSWAGDIINANPTHQVIVLTHSYLNDDGTHTEDSDEHGPDDYTITDASSGVDMWAEFKQYHNVIAVFNGHHINGPLTAELTSTGDDGNKVFQQFTNWQTETEGGEGRIVILTVNPFTGKAAREVYNSADAAFEPTYDLEFELFGEASASSDADAIHDNVSGEIQAVTEKTTPADADLLLIEDSEASHAKKSVQVGNLPGGTTSGGSGEILISDTPSTPLVFADLIQNEDQDDLVYAD